MEMVVTIYRNQANHKTFVWPKSKSDFPFTVRKLGQNQVYLTIGGEEAGFLAGKGGEAKVYRAFDFFQEKSYFEKKSISISQKKYRFWRLIFKCPHFIISKAFSVFPKDLEC